MNREKVRHTAVCMFDRQKKLYIVKSPLLDICVGAAKTELQAWKLFEDILDDLYISYLEGRKVGRYARRGRPASGAARIHIQVKQHTKAGLERLAKQLSCSLGETVDYLFAYKLAAEERKSSPKSGISTSGSDFQPTIAKKRRQKDTAARIAEGRSDYKTR